MPLQQGDQRSLPWQQHWRIVPNHNWSSPRLSALPHPLQHLLRIIADALGDHEGTVSIGGRTITDLLFADVIDGLDGQEQELVKLVNHLEEASTAYSMQVNAGKTQLMTNNTNSISTDITTDNQKLETVRSFKYLGTIVLDEGSKPEVLSRIAQTTAAVTKLKVIWNDKNIAINSKIRLMRSLAMPTFSYACETWRRDVSANSSVSHTEIT